MVHDKPINPSSFTDDHPELVEHQLASILESPHFKSAKKMQAFLRYVVRKALAGKSSNLKQYTIAVEGLNYPVDFDSDTNPAIRIMAGRVRDRLEKYYDSEGEADALVISMPKGSYSPLFKEKARTQIIPEKTGHSIPPKLAVLCYSDETQNKESNRLLFQITDTMAMEMSHFIFSKLVVSIPHADKREARFASIEIKERFQADYMLIFYIQQLPKKQHSLLVRLMDVEEEGVLWSESYELSEKSFDEQHEVIANITAVVTDLQHGLLHHHWARKLLEDEASIPDYYRSLAYYRYYNDDMGRDAFVKASEACKQFLDLNPNDVISLLIYTDYCRRDYVYGYNEIENPLELGKELAEKAIQLKPFSHEAHYVYGQILFCLHEYEQCLETFKEVRSFYRYHSIVEYGVGFHYCLMGEWDEGLKIIQGMMSTSTSYPTWCNFILFLDSYLNKKFDKALSYALKIKTPQVFHRPLARCVSYIELGEVDKAKIELQELLLDYPNFMEQGQQLLERFLGSKEVSDRLWEGLIKAKDS